MEDGRCFTGLDILTKYKILIHGHTNEQTVNFRKLFVCGDSSGKSFLDF